MEQASTAVLLQRVTIDLRALLRQVDIDTVDADYKKLLGSLRRLLVDVRLDVRDYELSETRHEQLGKAEQGKKHLATLRNRVLAASDLFGPADIAHITARLEQIASRLQ